MTALESLLAAIDAMAAVEDRGTTHYEGCEAEHPRCKVYRAAEAVKAAESVRVTVTMDERPCRWRAQDWPRRPDEPRMTECGHRITFNLAGDGEPAPHAAGGLWR